MAETDYSKVWLQDSLNRIGIARAADAVHRLGAALPCRVTAVSGSFVTVAFEVDASPWTLPQITIPKAEGPWIRTPTQVGDFGLTIPADAYLTAITGQGGAAVPMTRPGNLAALAWLPVASKAFPAININAAYVAGPQGAVVGTSDGKTVITANETGVTITAGGKTWTFGAGGLTMSNGIVAETHQHDYIPGSGAQTTTSGPVA